MVGRILRHTSVWSIALVSVAVLMGCASSGGYVDPRDPLEPYNRAVYAFNDDFDRIVGKPLARGYKAVAPEFIDLGITNFFSNLTDLNSALNNLLQFKLERAGSDLGRLTVNSTLGVLGVMDVASGMGLPRHHEDFGQTFGVWGIEPGPYLVLPLLGPSSTRDVVGLVLGWYVDPLRWMVESDALTLGLLGVWYVDRRADLLGASAVLQQAALDPYEFVRDGYFQKRRYDVYDGNPPSDLDWDDDFDDFSLEDE